MNKAVGFCDLNIPSSQVNLKETVVQALRLGYRTIAITTKFSDIGNIASGSKKKKEAVQFIPPPFEFALSTEELKSFGIVKPPIILTRITITFSDPASSIFHKCKEVLSKYDIVAFAPTTEASFKQICTSNYDVDIVCLEGGLGNFRLSRKLLKLVLARDVYFEISYGACLVSSDRRKRMIQQAHLLQQLAPSAKIIVSSNAQQATHIRAPYDVANLCLLFGLSEGLSKAAISALSLEAVECASLRRSGISKCSMQVDSISNGNDTDLPESKRRKYDSLREPIF